MPVECEHCGMELLPQPCACVTHITYVGAIELMSDLDFPIISKMAENGRKRTMAALCINPIGLFVTSDAGNLLHRVNTSDMTSVTTINRTVFVSCSVPDTARQLVIVLEAEVSVSSYS